MKTINTFPNAQDGSWYLIDIKNKNLGRVASQIAFLLMGKHRPTYTPYWCHNDKVVVIHAASLSVTGNKIKDKIYYRHSGYPGGLKKMTFEEQVARKPTFALQHAVNGMLPKNRLGRLMRKNLLVYPDDSHPHQSQTPMVLTGRLHNKKELFEALRTAQRGAEKSA